MATETIAAKAPTGPTLHHLDVCEAQADADAEVPPFLLLSGSPLVML